MNEVILIGLVIVILAGAASGIISLGLILSLWKRLEKRVSALESALHPPEGEKATPKAARAPIEVKRVMGPRPTPPPAAKREGDPLLQEAEAQPLPPQARSVTPKPETQQEVSSLEMLLGSKWLNWVGMVLVIAALGYFMKYAYDNAWVGPRGRLIFSTCAGVAALILGEWARRSLYTVLFHVLSGGGIGTFYVCIYFSFQVHQFIEPVTAITLSVLVTALAVVMGVLHNARVICVIGQIGGYLSPVLLSTGANQPIQLFTYVLILNYITIWCAYFKNWPVVNACALAGTAFLYVPWLVRAYDPSQLTVALVFSTLFYLTFLHTPFLRSMIERSAAAVESLKFMVFVIVLGFLNYFVLLVDGYQTVLAFVVLAQAGLLFGLSLLWNHRCPDDRRTGNWLVVAALVLVTIAIPIRLRLYALPIAWAIQAVLLAYTGTKYDSRSSLLFSLVALTLAVLGLLSYLPLHTEPFVRIVNKPFASWAIVIAAAFAVYGFQRKNRGDTPSSVDADIQRTGPLAIGVVLSCVLMHLELTSYWLIQSGSLGAVTAVHRADTSGAILWSVICLLFIEIARMKTYPSWTQLVPIASVAGLVVVCPAVFREWPGPWLPFLNVYFLSRILFAAALLWTARRFQESGVKNGNATAGGLEVFGHLIPVAYIAVEVSAWTRAGAILSPMHQHGIISGLWSLYALGLIVVGLQTRVRLRRILGFVLFGITVLKILILDMSLLQPVYRIASLLACGVLLIVAGYVYQKYAKTMLDGERGSSSET